MDMVETESPLAAPQQQRDATHRSNFRQRFLVREAQAKADGVQSIKVVYRLHGTGAYAHGH
jgi:hypothetical protein